MNMLVQYVDYATVTDKLMNVVVMVENLTPGVVMIQNLHSGVRVALRDHMQPPFTLEPHHGMFLLVGESRRLGHIALRVNMRRDFRRRLEFAQHLRDWKPFMLDGYTSLVMPRKVLGGAMRLLVRS
jgi:hypothetical protein